MIVSAISFKTVLNELQGEKLGNFASHEWKRIINPYTPHRDGNLERNVAYRPWEFEYLEPYAHYQYNGSVYVDPLYQKGGFTSDGGITFFSRPDVKKIDSGRPLNYSKEHNPKASRRWDEAAKRDGQDSKLVNAIQKWIDRNI